MPKLKCCGCKERFEADTMLSLPAGNFHSKDCAILYATAKQERSRARLKAKAGKEKRVADKATRAATKAAKKKDLRWQHKVTQAAFNKMRVQEELLWFKDRGLEPTCISCGYLLGGDQWCCGHFKTRGAQSGLRYDRRNTFLQHNRRCNMMLSGDIEGSKTTRGYKKGLVYRFGEEEGQAIIEYCQINVEPIKWQWEALEKNRAEYLKRIRELKRRLGNVK